MNSTVTYGTYTKYIRLFLHAYAMERIFTHVDLLLAAAAAAMAVVILMLLNAGESNNISDHKDFPVQSATK